MGEKGKVERVKRNKKVQPPSKTADNTIEVEEQRSVDKKMARSNIGEVDPDGLVMISPQMRES